MPIVGFVGLGVMGAPMATHVHNAVQNGKLSGIADDFVVWNRSIERRRPLMDMGVAVANSLPALAEVCSTILICVNRTEDVRNVLDDLRQTAKPGTLFIDHSTILPEAAKGFASELEGEGMRFLDAPITGGSMGAKQGTLTIFCGGREDDFKRAQPILSCYARRAELVGTSGMGQMMKMVNQIAVGGALMALCEALSFAKKAGLDLPQTRELVGSGAAGSWAFENYGPKILNRDWSPGFSIDNQVKDFYYCQHTAESLGAAIPGTELVCRLLEQLQDQGRGQDTTAALYELLLSLAADECSD
jgi:3-hydroxyisobutyrate dehydrogenase-like beta-hydroxyacid dehydrogenase